MTDTKFDALIPERIWLQTGGAYENCGEPARPILATRRALDG